VRVLGVVAAVLLGGNLAILGGHFWLRRSLPAPTIAVPVRNFHMVDAKVWRGAAPSPAALAALADNGVTTIVDLRAEDGISVDEDRLVSLGLRRYHLPLRDGQAPSPEQVAAFRAIVAESEGPIYVHCGAGVGRTGTMVAAYTVSSGAATPLQATARNLAVGPPSLEQLAFAAGLEPDRVERPGPLVVAVSRVLDAPRRTWVHIRGSYTR
jgi:protein tyrosine phosphatase (PTP) superfamily phosphohydrolase (DUF442 family)